MSGDNDKGKCLKGFLFVGWERRIWLLLQVSNKDESFILSPTGFLKPQLKANTIETTLNSLQTQPQL